MAKPIIKVDREITPEKIYAIDQRSISEGKPVVGITYLDNSYNFTDLFKIARGNNRKIKEFEGFLEKARHYTTLTDLIDAHKPHKGCKNEDDKSKQKMNDIQKKYNVETKDMFHLHCCRNGNGEFVIHGFRINNCFEIVWLDPEHKIHKLK